MNLVLLEPSEAGAGGRVVLGGRRAAHLREVLRPEVGATLRVGVIGGPRGRGIVRAVGESEVELELTLDAPASPDPGVHLVLAVPRPKALRRILQDVAAMGVSRVDLTNAWRVEKSYLDSPRLSPAALREELVLGCEQGATTWLPAFEVHPRLMPLLETLPPAGTDVAVLADPKAETFLDGVPGLAPSAGSPARVVVAVGPEGGWIDRERASFAERGFVPARLGGGVLRTEAAVTALLAQLVLLRRLAGP